jgi:hypothetical protein
MLIRRIIARALYWLIEPEIKAREERRAASFRAMRDEADRYAVALRKSFAEFKFPPASQSDPGEP